MISVEKSVIINKPVQEVFTFVTAEDSYKKIQPDVTEVIEHGPRNTVGSSYTEVRKFLGQDMRNTIEVTTFEPNAKWVGKVIKGPVYYEMTVTYEATNGGTKFTTKITSEPKGFFKVAESLVASQLEKTVAENSQRLKDLLEKG